MHDVADVDLQHLDIFVGFAPSTPCTRLHYLKRSVARDAKANKKLEDIHAAGLAETHKQALALAQAMLPALVAQAASGNSCSSMV